MDFKHRATLTLCLLLISSCGQGDSLAAAARTTLVDVDEPPHSTFSLRAGRAVVFEKGDGPEVEFPEDFDLILDLPKGLATNNGELSPNFTGSGGIVSLGEVPMEDVTEAPESGYKLALKQSELIPGHSYCVRVGDGVHYAKIHIIAFNEEEKSLEFEWQYQPQDTRSF